MKKSKLHEINMKYNIFFRRNYKEYSYKFAWKRTGIIIEGKELICKWKNCKQDLMDPNETVYF